MDLCLKQEIINRCKCFAIFADRLNGSNACISLNEINCVFQISKNKVNIYTDCLECKDTCDSVSYPLTTSTSLFPSFDYGQFLVNYSFLANETFFNKTDLDKSVLSLTIFYSSLKYTEIKQLVKMGVIDLICAIGGILGLFIGASILSFVEVLEAVLLGLKASFAMENK